MSFFAGAFLADVLRDARCATAERLAAVDALQRRRRGVLFGDGDSCPQVARAHGRVDGIAADAFRAELHLLEACGHCLLLCWVRVCFPLLGLFTFGRLPYKRDFVAVSKSGPRSWNTVVFRLYSILTAEHTYSAVFIPRLAYSGRHRRGADEKDARHFKRSSQVKSSQVKSGRPVLVMDRYA